MISYRLLLFVLSELAGQRKEETPKETHPKRTTKEETPKETHPMRTTTGETPKEYPQRRHIKEQLTRMDYISKSLLAGSKVSFRSSAFWFTLMHRINIAKLCSKVIRWNVSVPKARSMFCSANLFLRFITGFEKVIFKSKSHLFPDDGTAYALPEGLSSCALNLGQRGSKPH